jgi:hypothetical protein
LDFDFFGTWMAQAWGLAFNESDKVATVCRATLSLADSLFPLVPAQFVVMLLPDNNSYPIKSK